MKKEDKKVNTYIFEYKMGYITFISLILFIIPVLLTWAYYKLSNTTLNINIIESSSLLDCIVICVLMFLWMILHEIIHGIAYHLNGAKNENITFGAALEKGVFYCKCGEFINKKNIIISLLSPFMIIGVITLIIGWLINSFLLIALSVINISGAAGDLAMFGFFIKQDNNLQFKELGDSTTFCLKTKDDLSTKKYLSVKLKKVVTDDKEITEEKAKKVTISKTSWLFFIFFGLIILIDAILAIFVK